MTQRRTRGELSLPLIFAIAVVFNMTHTQSSLAGCNAAGKIFTAITIDDNDIPTYLCVDGSETVSVSVNGVNNDSCNITLEVKDGSAGDVTITPAQATATVGGPDASFTVTGASGGALILVATIAGGTGSPCTDESEEFTVLDVDLDGEEPDGDGGLDPVDDTEDYSPGILLVSSESKLVVQDPGVDSGTLTLTWPSPLPGEADKKLEIDGDSDGTYEIDCSTATWPVKLLVKTLKNDGGWAEGDWDYDDYVEVTMTHSALAGCADEVTLTIIKVDFEEDPNQNYGFDPDGPWVSIEKSKTTTVKVNIAPSSAASQVYFTSSDTSKVTVSPSQASGSPQTLTLTAGATEDDSAVIDARIGSTAGWSCASLGVAVYEKQPISCFVHKVNGYSGSIPVTQVNDVFKQAVVRIDTYSEDTRTCDLSAGYAYDVDESEDEHIDLANTGLSPGWADVFVIPSPGKVRTAGGEIRFGMHYHDMVLDIHWNIVSETASPFYRYFAHELFHYWQPGHESDSDNLMHSDVTGEHLNKAQWDLAH